MIDPYWIYLLMTQISRRLDAHDADPHEFYYDG